LQVTVVTPCCGEPLQGVPIYVDKKWVGKSGSDGRLQIKLPPGRHSVTSHYEEQVVTADPAISIEKQEITLTASGELFLFLKDMSFDDDVKDGVFLCSNRELTIDPDASFDVGGFLSGAPRAAGLRVSLNKSCTEAMRNLRIAPKDGREYVGTQAFTTWVKQMEADSICLVKEMFTTEKRVGDLVGSRKSAADRTLLKRAVSSSPRSTRSTAASDGTRPPPSPRSKLQWIDPVVAKAPDLTFVYNLNKSGTTNTSNPSVDLSQKSHAHARARAQSASGAGRPPKRPSSAYCAPPRSSSTATTARRQRSQPRYQSHGNIPRNCGQLSAGRLRPSSANNQLRGGIFHLSDRPEY